MPRDRAQPEFRVQPPDPGFAVEIDRGVDDRALTVILLQDGDEIGRLAQNLGRAGAARAGLGMGPFDVQDRRQRARLARDIADVPGGLLGARAAEIVVMIGAARDAGIAGLAPVAAEFGVGMIGALGRLQERKADAGRAARFQSIFPCQREMSMPWTGMS